MVGEYLGDDSGDALPGRNVQEFVGTVRIRVRAEHTGDDEFCLRELLPEHCHERDGAAFAHKSRRRSEGSHGGLCQRLLEPRGQGGGVPSDGIRPRLVHDPRPIWRGFLQQCANEIAGCRRIQGWRQS